MNEENANTEAGNELLLVPVRSAAQLRQALQVPQPAAILLVFEFAPEEIEQIAGGSGYRYKGAVPEQEEQMEPGSIYLAKGSLLRPVLSAGREKQLEELLLTNSLLEKRAAGLAETNAELERFAYIASHDLQEPLRMVTGFLQLLKKRYDSQLDDSAQQYIRFAVDGAERMKKLISDLLEYSRLGSTKEDIAVVDLNIVIYDVIALFNDRLTQNDARVDCGYLPVVKGKKVQLMQLFQNLFSNAIKYRSEEPLQIKVSCVEKSDCWEITVADNGIGIDSKFYEKIFVIFQRLHSNSEYSGTGIGLAVCKKIAERHGGKMWVESEPGKGSRFSFSIAKNY